MPESVEDMGYRVPPNRSFFQRGCNPTFSISVVISLVIDVCKKYASQVLKSLFNVFIEDCIGDCKE